MTEDQLSNVIIGAALEVHREMRPGLMENVYEHCLAYELHSQGLLVERQVELPVIYRGVKMELGYRLDLWVERSVVVEVKAVEAFHPVHTAQVLNYLKLTGNRLGLLLNFNVTLLKSGGIKRIANGLP